MKQRILFITLGILIYSPFAYAQIANLNFENWTTEELFDDPDGFVTSNFQTYVLNSSVNVTQEEVEVFEGMYSAHLETVDINGEITPGGLLIGQSVDGDFQGGLPFTGTPDSLRFKINHEIAVDDSAQIAILLLAGNTILAGAQVYFEGSSDGYIEVTQEITYIFPLSPTQLIFAAFSSDFDGPIEGSQLWLDNIELVYEEDGDQIPNGDFELWSPVELEEPDDWNTSNLFTFLSGTSVSKSTDSFSGDFAARLETRQVLDEESENFSFLVNGMIGEDGPIGGTVIDPYPASIEGMYKYDAVDTEDSAAVYVLFTYENDMAEIDTLYENVFLLGEVMEYTAFQFEFPIEQWYGDGWPDEDVTLFLGFSSTKITDDEYDAPEGSVLYLDDVSLPVLLSVDDNFDEAGTFKIFPNPSQGVVNFNWSEMEDPESLRIFDAKGILVGIYDIRSLITGSHSASLDLSKLAQGFYFAQIRFGNSAQTTRFQIVK